MLSKTTSGFMRPIVQKSVPVSDPVFSQEGLALGKHSLSMVNSGTQLPIDGLILENPSASAYQTVFSMGSSAMASITRLLFLLHLGPD